MVAALIPSIANSIFAETVQGLADGLQGSGCELLLAATNYSTAREEAQLRALMGWFPSAIVVTGTATAKVRWRCCGRRRPAARR